MWQWEFTFICLYICIMFVFVKSSIDTEVALWLFPMQEIEDIPLLWPDCRVGSTLDHIPLIFIIDIPANASVRLTFWKWSLYFRRHLNYLFVDILKYKLPNIKDVFTTWQNSLQLITYTSTVFRWLGPMKNTHIRLVRNTSILVENSIIVSKMNVEVILAL
jgi:hypothetical protein